MAALETDRKRLLSHGHGARYRAGQSVAANAWVAYAALGSFTGLTVSSVPVGFTGDGRPIGLQIMGRHRDDLGVLALSAAVESFYPPVLPPLSSQAAWADQASTGIDQ